MDFLIANSNRSGKKKPVYRGRSGRNSKIKNVKGLKRVIPELAGVTQDHMGLQKMSDRADSFIYKKSKLMYAKSFRSPRKFDPEKYGMIICPGCTGYGFIEDDVGRNICLKCGGFGLIKKEEDPRENGDG